MHKPAIRHRGFTLIELMVTVAVAALLITLVAPSFRELILMQRLRGIESQLVTDMQFARAEAVSRSKYTLVKLNHDTTQTCYTIYFAQTDDGLSNAAYCNCTRGVGTACTSASGVAIADLVELKTVSVPQSSGVDLRSPDEDGDNGLTFAFDFVTGGLLTGVTDLNLLPLALVTIHSSIDDVRRLTTQLSQTGRPRTCGLQAANAQRMQVPQCRAE